MTTTEQGAALLRAMLRRDDLVVAPGAYDCITARAVAQAGAEAVYMTGAGTAAALGYPDYGLLTQTEMADNAGRMAQAVAVPLIADADTGYGNELNTIRTVREYERRGVAALHLEDQRFPKKCGHLDDKSVIDAAEFVSRIRAAVDARREMLIIARTDARAEHGLPEAVARANAALDAGADLAFVEAPQTVEEVEAVPRLVHGPCLLNLVPGGRTPLLDFAAVQRAGYKVAILPGVLLAAVVGACDRILGTTLAEGRHPDFGSVTPRKGFSRFGADEWDAHRERYAEVP
ncbi:2-methylisocitrate lyase-like PEP mutase family enzyme [Thermocatellispora tengchongensis]|uniref:2-methylisocitrate lyase-like PEP mutase family enzyme n=1 Tax=Thermocatellispora tengchongensis TaxID=1073253 RepID=A0A840PPC9_9ACTN|nr:isocitrate lyase/PEP mutase family protein [Thermocatellispora tengchongensis]MBB5137875.1 2-methylisocitrate lyase-like PEP mutase family enzyme [Thermocatellispora tengchongensis]